MPAVYVRYHAGNAAIQQDVWTIPMDIAKMLMEVLDVRPGTYWESNFAKPYRKAVRAKAVTLKVYTAGFSTSDFHNALSEVGCAIEFAGNR